MSRELSYGCGTQEASTFVFRIRQSPADQIATEACPPCGSITRKCLIFDLVLVDFHIVPLEKFSVLLTVVWPRWRKAGGTQLTTRII